MLLAWGPDPIPGEWMRWPNLSSRFQRWFAEAVARGDYPLAESFAAMVAALEAAQAHPSLGIKALFDDLDLAELAKSEVRELAAEPRVDLHAVAADLEGLFREFGLWPDEGHECREPLVPYRVNAVSAPPMLRARARAASGA